MVISCRTQLESISALSSHGFRAFVASGSVTLHRQEHAFLSETLEGRPVSVEVHETSSISVRDIPLARATGTGDRLMQYLEYEQSFMVGSPACSQLVVQSFDLSERMLHLTCYVTPAQFDGAFQLAQRYFPFPSIELHVASRLQLRSLEGDAPLLTESEFFRGGFGTVSYSTHLGLTFINRSAIPRAQDQR
jgi:hypothetical protein